MRAGILLVLLACAAWSGSVKHEAAEDKTRTVPGGASLGVKRCHEDIDRFCAGVKPGESRLGKCLKSNEKKLSKGCRHWLEHGGPGHVEKAYLEIDLSTAPVKR
jgi:hypothetical protein